jgi:hypothetical protein
MIRHTKDQLSRSTKRKMNEQFNMPPMGGGSKEDLMKMLQKLMGGMGGPPKGDGAMPPKGVTPMGGFPKGVTPLGGPPEGGGMGKLSSIVGDPGIMDKIKGMLPMLMKQKGGNNPIAKIFAQLGGLTEEVANNLSNREKRQIKEAFSFIGLNMIQSLQEGNQLNEDWDPIGGILKGVGDLLDGVGDHVLGPIIKPVLQPIKDIAGGVDDVIRDVYDWTGLSPKEFFNLIILIVGGAGWPAFLKLFGGHWTWEAIEEYCEEHGIDLPCPPFC